MGKATEVADRIAATPLSADEIRKRREAQETGDASEATLDGKIIKRATASRAPEPVHQAPPRTWD